MQLVKQNRHTQGSQAKWTSTSLLVPEQRKVVLLLHDSWGQNWEVRANRTTCKQQSSFQTEVMSLIQALTTQWRLLETSN